MSGGVRGVPGGTRFSIPETYQQRARRLLVLTLGLFTRPVALLGSVYLLMSMLWGGHFQIDYVWALPEGGYEFGVFWAVMIAVFAVLGGGRNSVDSELWRSEPARRLLPGIVRKVLAS